MSESHGTVAYSAVTQQRAGTGSRPYGGAEAAAPKLTAVPSAPTLEGVNDVASSHLGRLQDLVKIYGSIADRLGGQEPERNGTAEARPGYSGLVGSLDSRLDEAQRIVNELFHHSGRIERALSPSA